MTTDQNDYIVHATAVHKTYSTGKVTVPALRGIDLRVKRGEMVAIMGPSGCGKTTTLNCLSGLDEIDAGSVEVDGQLIHDLPDDERSDYRARRMGLRIPALQPPARAHSSGKRGDAPARVRRKLQGGEAPLA